MCIIIAKNRGTKAPTKKILETCFMNNPDGAGFMYSDGRAVHISKGHTTFKEFYRAARNIPTDAAAVYHFRIATHGGINPQMTQPFPLSRKKKDLRALDVTACTGVAHNGIIPITSDARSMSDTALFIQRYLTRLISGASIPRWKADIIEELAGGSRLAILDRTGKISLIGEWIEEGGLMYSNKSYKREPLKIWQCGGNCFSCENIADCYPLAAGGEGIC